MNNTLKVRQKTFGVFFYVVFFYLFLVPNVITTNPPNDRVYPIILNIDLYSRKFGIINLTIIIPIIEVLTPIIQNFLSLKKFIFFNHLF